MRSVSLACGRASRPDAARTPLRRQAQGASRPGARHSSTGPLGMARTAVMKGRAAIR